MDSQTTSVKIIPTVPVIKKFLSELFISEKQKDSGNIQKVSEMSIQYFCFILVKNSEFLSCQFSVFSDRDF